MAGRPLKYKTVEEMEATIHAYFEKCNGEPIMVDNPETGEKEPYLDKGGNPVLINCKPPTVTGLALALGFNSRQSLLNYQGRKQFMDTITRAKSLVEEYAETRLFDKDGVNGAKFSLINNFAAWKEKVDVTSNTEVKIVDDIPKGEDGG